MFTGNDYGNLNVRRKTSIHIVNYISKLEAYLNTERRVSIC